MFKIARKLVTAAALFGAATSALSMPMLSEDGSLLTGVVADGQIYDVTFGDGILGDIYTTSMVEQEGWFDLANAVKQGIADAFNMLSDQALPADISGCDGSEFSPFLAGCLMIIPDVLLLSRDEQRFVDSNGVALTTAGAIRFPSSGIVSVGSDFDTAVDFEPGQLTIAQFRLATRNVPAPGSLGLLMSALVMVRWFRKQAMR